MISEIEKSQKYLWNEKETMTSVKGPKSPKKSQEGRKLMNDMKIEDVFLNSEYFKHRSGNISSLSFCSGDNGEYHWTVDTKFENSTRQKSPKPYPNEAIKSDTAVLEKSRLGKRPQQKIKPQHPTPEIDPPEEKTDKLLKGILTGKGRLDRDLITFITEQMFSAERELQITRTHLVETMSKLNERDLEILQLHEKIENLQANRKTKNTKTEQQNETSSKTSEDYHKLILASEKLKKQVKDMEEFLNDYGLVWVGERNYKKPDFDEIVKSFQKLNSVATEPRIIQTSVGAKFEVPREIPVVLYSNGFLLRGEQFRDYNDFTAAHFLQDVEDGYFPSELQAEFPDGVPFEVIDKRNEVYSIQSKTPVFQGHGNRLGSTIIPKSSSMVCLEPLKKIRNHDSHTMATKRSLLMKVHKKRPRNSVSEEDKIATVVTPPFTPVDDEDTLGSVINVKIRFGRGETESFVLQVPEMQKMFSFQVLLHRKLCELYHDDYVKTNQTEDVEPDFEIHVYGRHPFRLSDNLHLYPEECGIFNNCVINVTEI